jgi:hypothetical protein
MHERVREQRSMLAAPGVSQPHEDGTGASPPAGTWRRAAPYALPVLAAVAALAVSWQSWIDPFVDSGREMDVPWRLLQGERLYGDITYYYGPVGPWVNALALRLLGSDWLSLELVCAALSALIFVLLFRLTRRAGGLLSAATATTLAAAVCMGAPRGGAFIFPYSSSSLFALAGGLLALDAASAPGPRRRLLGALGIAVALASRLELGAAAAAALVLAGIRSRHREETRADMQVVTLGALIAGGVYGVALAGIPASSRLADGPFAPFLGMPKEWGFLYRMILGVEQPGNASSRMAVSLLLDGVLLAAAGWWALPRVDRPARPGRRHRFAIAGLLLLAAYLLSPWCVTAKNLPPLLAILPPVALAAALTLLRQPLEERGRSRFLLFFFSAAVAARVFFGIELGPRMGPNAALPMPGLLATAAVLAFDLLAPRLPSPEVFRRRLAAIFAVAGILFLYRIERLDHQPQTAELRTAAGALRLPAVKAAAIAHTLAYLDGRARAGDTLTAFPESGFFNFVTGLRSPLQQDLIVPGVLSGAREAAAVRRIDAFGPKYILLCNRTTAEFGPAAFGRDYAVELWSDVGRHYVLAAAFGPAAPAAPVGAKDFFIRLYERSPAASAPLQLASTGLRRQPTPSLPVLE